ncbi:MAG: four helix bundle protein [Clostridia bacterium]|nr:four helix bundle protein [Clostridia bacterium]
MDKTPYTELKVWQKSMDMVEEVYRVTLKIPDCERFGLIPQIRRAAVSVPSNIAEGYARISTKEYINFLAIARGSNAEITTQLLICKRLGYLSDSDIATVMLLLEEIGKMISAIINKLGTKKL